MARPRKKRQTHFNPKALHFKPQGIPLKELKIEFLNKEELESVRLKYVVEMDQTLAAEKMGTSQSTFQRILKSALKKIAVAITEGKAIEIEE